MPERKAYDLIVVGGGPAGTTIATLVKKHDPKANVLVIEKSRFPRHHVGESLLPGLIPVLKEMGVFEKIEKEGFPRKVGATFVWGRDRKPWDADFSALKMEMLRRGQPAPDLELTWQVLRSRYDEILIEHARSRGVEVWDGARAERPVEKRGRVVGLVVEAPDGRRRELGCRMLADCSGQNSFLSQARATRRYRGDLKNLAAYAYFKGARWKFEYAGHPDKTRIFVCSVPEGWFWYIPLSRELVSVGLVSKASYIKTHGGDDYRAHFFRSLKACAEIWPLLEGAEVARGIDPGHPEKDFFTAGDWSFESGSACGDGWLAAGDAAFFIDPLLSSGVMMAHLSGHRAAYTITTSWRETDPALRRRLWKDYDRFCKEVGGSFLSLVRYWYHNDPNSRRWWKQAKTMFNDGSPLELGDKMSFVAVASGTSFFCEQAYLEASRRGDGGLKYGAWRRADRDHNIPVLGLFLTGGGSGRWRRKTKAPRRARSDADVPRWHRPPKGSPAFVPVAGSGLLRPVRRFDFGEGPVPARRLLSSAHAAMVGAIDGRSSLAQIKKRLYGRLPLPRFVIDDELASLVGDLSSLGALRLSRARKPKNGGVISPASWAHLREGEELLMQGDNAGAEGALSAALGKGLRVCWAYALRGEARRHLGRLDESARDLDRAVTLSERAPLVRGRRLEVLRAEFDFAAERDWLRSPIMLLRAMLRLQRGEGAAALLDVESVLSAEPRNREALILKAKILSPQKSGRPEIGRARQMISAATLERNE